MAKGNRKRVIVTAANRAATPSLKTGRTYAALSAQGIATATNFKGMLTALIADVLTGSVDAGQGAVICNASGKYLDVVKMEFRMNQLKNKIKPNRFLLA